MLPFRPLILTGLYCLATCGITAALGSTRTKLQHLDNGLNLGDHFGASVTLDGSLAAVGVPLDDVDQITDAGHVEIFEKSEGWSPTPTLLFPPESHASGRFGATVLLQGTTLLVAEPGTAGGGMVHVYEQDIDTEWVLTATLSTNETTLGDAFGSALAMEGNTVFIGAPNTPGGGAVYVFERNGDTWTRNQKVVSTDIDEGDRFGAALAAHNGLLAVGAPDREDEAGDLTDSGGVYLFVLESSLWQQDEIALPAIADQRSGAAFGAAVGLRDDRLLVGAPKEDDPLYGADHGAAYVLSYDGFDWLQDARLLMPDSPLYAAGAFGTCVLLGDGYVVIGAPAAASANALESAGAVVAFYFDPLEGWVLHQALRDEPGRKQAALGSAIAISGDDLLVGAPLDRDLGSARLFQYELEGNEWLLDFSMFQPTADGGPDKKLGFSIATSGGLTVAGQPSDVTWDSDLIGSVYVYDNGRATQVAKLLAPSWAPMPGDDFFDVPQNFGTAVAAELTGGQGIIAATSSAGVFVYRASLTGIQLEAWLELPPSGSSAPFPPDYTLAISDGTILVGNPYELFNDKELGAVHVFVKEGASWRRQTVLRGSQDRGAFGAGLAIKGDTAVVGAPATAPSNAAFSAAYVFTRSGVTWTQRRQLTSPVPRLDFFGQFLAMEKGHLAVSVPGNEHGGRVLMYQGAGSVWALKQTLTGFFNDTHLGTSLSLDNGRLLAGLNGPGFFYGGAVTYALRDGQWRKQQSVSPESANFSAANYGVAASVSEADLAFGSPYENAGAGPSSGAVDLLSSPGTLELYDGPLAAGERLGNDGPAVLALDTLPSGLVLGVMTERIVTIYNGSPAIVQGLSAAVNGPSAGNITVVQPLLTSLAPGASTTFRLLITPSGSSIDADLHVSGTGLPVIDVAMTGSVLSAPQSFEFSSQPKSDHLVQTGHSLLLTAAVVAPPGSVSYRWLRNTRAVQGANGPELFIPHVTLADAGTYVLEATISTQNPPGGGLITSDPARVVIVGQPPTGVRWLSRGTALSLSIPIAGPDYAVEWQGTFGPLQNGSPISGAQTPNLRFSRLREGDFQDYTPVISLGNEPPLWLGSVTIQEVLPSAPTFFYSDLGTWTVGQAGTLALNLDIPPSPGFTFTATGLPPGLKLNSRTGVLSGTPTKEGLYQVRVVVSNRFGRTAQTIPVQVYPFNGGDEIAGAYQGLLNRDPTLNDNLGGSVKINLTRNGVCTGRVTFGSIVTNFICQLDLYYQGKVTLRSPDRRWEYDLRLTLDTFTNRFTGTITHDYAHFSATAFVAQRAETIEHLSGYYTGLLTPVEPQATDDSYPQGTAYSTARVSNDGSVLLAGRLADGAVITASTSSGYFGEAPVHVLLYNGIGSFQGTLLIRRTTEFFDNDYNILRGTFSWLKKPATSPKETSYAAGIPLHDLDMLSFRYFPPVSGSIVLALDPLRSQNAQITFEEGGLSAAALDPNLLFKLTTENLAELPSGLENPTGLTLKVDPATGLLSGGFTLNDPNPLNPLKALVRKVTFAGVLIPRLDGGFGSFQLPQLPTIDGKPSPVLSGNLQLEAYEPSEE